MENEKKMSKIMKYVEMNHSVQVKPDGKGFVATIPDLPGCVSQGDTYEEVFVMILDAKKAWIESAISEGESIPEPSEDKKFSGKILVRIPVQLHENLAIEAKKQGISLNHYLSYLLAKEHEREKVEHRHQLHYHKHDHAYNINIAGKEKEDAWQRQSTMTQKIMLIL